MTVVNVTWQQVFPFAIALRNASVPDFWLDVLAGSILPFIREFFDLALPVRALPHQVNKGELSAA